jgi:hypothetical protein
MLTAREIHAKPHDLVAVCGSTKECFRHTVHFSCIWTFRLYRLTNFGRSEVVRSKSDVVTSTELIWNSRDIAVYAAGRRNEHWHQGP